MRFFTSLFAAAALRMGQNVLPGSIFTAEPDGRRRRMNRLRHQKGNVAERSILSNTLRLKAGAREHKVRKAKLSLWSLRCRDINHLAVIKSNKRAALHFAAAGVLTTAN